MLSRTKKFVTMSVLCGMLATQTGCIAGLYTGINWLYIAGVLGSIGGQYGCATKKCFYIVSAISAVLDEKNPGRQDALNPLPMDSSIAQNLGTSLDGLDQYNNELNQVLKANSFLEGQVALVSTGNMQKDQLDAAASAVGFQNGEQLKSVLSQEQLSQADLAKFAQAQNLSQETARLYLQMRFGIKTL